MKKMKCCDYGTWVAEDVEKGTQGGQRQGHRNPGYEQEDPSSGFVDDQYGH